MNKKKIGKRITENRKKKQLTQQELANKLDVTNRTIINWENGKYFPDYALLLPLCEELDISINELSISSIVTPTSGSNSANSQIPFCFVS